MFLVFIFGWVVTFFILIKRKVELAYNPIMWLFIGWGLVFGLYYLSGIIYNYKLSLNAGLYYWGLFVFAWLGFLFSKKFKITLRTHGVRKIFPSLEKISFKNYRVYTLAVVMGAVLTVTDIFRLNSFSFSLHGNINLSAFSNIGILLTGLGLVLWLYECVRAVLNNQKLSFYAFVCLICYLIPSLITSGRQNILILGVSTFVVLYYGFSENKQYRYKKMIFIPILIGICLLFGYITIIAAYRTAVDSKISLFNFMYDCCLSKETSDILDKLGPFKTFIMETIYYYSHELSMFEIMFRYYNGPKFLGMSQLALISRNLPAGNGKSIYDMVWVHLDDISEQAGVYSHVWRSAAGNFYMDFGIVGGLIVAILCGYAIGRFYKKCMTNRNIYNIMGLSLICSGTFFAMQFSPFSENYWFYPIFWLITLPFIERIFAKR